MKRLGPQAKKLFEVAEKEPERKTEATHKYTFILPVELMKQVKHTAIEEETTISEWLAQALRERLARQKGALTPKSPPGVK
ncbi:MAG TPA: hypothetical protein PKX93_04585 [bacterium]|nr:hypothetical protein [bacterium]HOL66719.1 hypothetical protein [bacterium]HPP11874.1 hypothetical protein [bacterium]